MLFNKDIQFQNYPQTVKVGIVSLVAGWALHLTYYYIYFTGSELVRIDYVMIGVGLGICFFVAAINKWARMLCLFFNAVIVLIYLALALLQQADFELRLFSGVVAGIFSVSTYYLLKKETAEYFKIYNQHPEPERPE